MAGTIFSLPLSQQFDAETGEFLSGGLLYIYAAETTTPSTIYADATLDNTLANPLELDSAGRVPVFWLADGNYRAVLRNSDGVTQFDITSTPSLGASSATGTGTSVDTNTLIKTGYTLWLPVTGTLTGWVRMNGRTIGSSGSGAAERANADVEDLFLYVWNNFTDAQCAVGTGRGGSAALDWAANKPIATLDMRGRLAYGLDTMGNSAASVFTAATTAGDAYGGQSTSVTILQANLPNISFNISGVKTLGAGVTTASATTTAVGARNLFTNADFGSTSGVVPTGGSGTALTIPVLPAAGRAGSFYWKL